MEWVHARTSCTGSGSDEFVWCEEKAAICQDVDGECVFASAGDPEEPGHAGEAVRTRNGALAGSCAAALVFRPARAVMGTNGPTMAHGTPRGAVQGEARGVQAPGPGESSSGEAEGQGQAGCVPRRCRAGARRLGV